MDMNDRVQIKYIIILFISYEKQRQSKNFYFRRGYSAPHLTHI